MRKYAQSFKDEEKMTRDSFAAECDINNIVETYARTGMVNHLPRTAPQYGEAPSISFHEAATIAAEIASAKEEGWEPTPEEKSPPEASQALSEPEEAPAPQDAAPDESSGK